MSITYQSRNGIEYGKIDGRSYRKNGTVYKEKQIYLGRVIDKDKHVFYNRQKGVFIYDEANDAYLEADDSYSVKLEDDGRKKQKLSLDFGDSFFIDSLIRSIGYDQVIDAIDYRNKDTLRAMISFYTLNDYALAHALTWYKGNFASILYPKANLVSQRLSDFLHTLGDDFRQRQYFKAHIGWLKTNVCDDPAIIVDSTGLPNDIDTYLSDISNHNGIRSNEIRMTTAVQRDSGYPLLYRLSPGNINDISILSRTIATLEEYDVNTDIALLDAGYYTNENVDSLCKAHIDFVSRLPERNSTLYEYVLSKCLDHLERKENLIEYNKRYIYISSTDVKIGSMNKYPARAYLGLDVARRSDETYKAVKRAGKDNSQTNQMHKKFQSAGLFIIISTLPYKDEDILPVYYARQMIEQYYDISKGISRLIPLRVHSEESIRGHCLLSQIAATLNLTIQKKIGNSFNQREELFLSLRNQKCDVYKNRIITTEAQSGANEFYDKFKIECPMAFKKQGDILIPQKDLNRRHDCDQIIL